ncbi:MAG: TRAP transporter substrate-binding protein [Kiloniellales bacterium]
MKKMLSFLAAGLIAAALSTVTPTGPVQAGETWDMPTPYGDGNFHTININAFAADVKAATKGALEIKVHSAGSLFKHPEIKNAVRGGQVPIGEFLLSRLSNENAIFAVDSVPFLATDYDAAGKLWAVSRGKTEALFDKQGLKVLFAVPWPPQGIYANKPLNSVDDLKGVKFRAYNTATERIAQLAGAVPTQIELADIAQAFSTGRVEAMITSPSTGVSHKTWDFLSHFYHTQAWLPKNIVVVNKKAFAGLDASVQAAVLAAAEKAEARGWQASRDETDKKMKILADNGMKVGAPGPAFKAGLEAIGKTMTDEWAGQAGADGKAILKAYGG